MSDTSVRDHTKRETHNLELYDNLKYKLVAHNRMSEWIAETIEGGDCVRVDHKKKTEDNDDIDDIFTITGTKAGKALVRLVHREDDSDPNTATEQVELTINVKG